MIQKIIEKATSSYKKEMETIKQDVIDRITPKEVETIEKIIHSAAMSAAAASAVLAPGAVIGADTAVLIPIHVAMIITIGEVFHQSIGKDIALGILAGASGVALGSFGARAILGLIPIVGSVANASVSFICTEVIGWWSVKHYFAKIEIDEHLPIDKITSIEKCRSIYSTISEKVNALRHEYIIETNPGTKFGIKKQIEEAEQEMNQAEARIELLKKQQNEGTNGNG